MTPINYKKLAWPDSSRKVEVDPIGLRNGTNNVDFIFGERQTISRVDEPRANIYYLLPDRERERESVLRTRKTAVLNK